MRWKEGRRSENVEDRRNQTPKTVLAGGGLGTIAIILIAMFLGLDPRMLLGLRDQMAGGPAGQAQQRAGRDAGGAGAGAGAKAGQGGPTDELADFVSVVLGDTEDVWSELFAAMGKTYREPTLVLFTDRVSSACGVAGSAVGPFYCPADQKVYIDLGFYRDLREKLGAPGDFAQAYVIAHEIGHHVQNLLGATRVVDSARGRVSETEQNQLSVRLELQADFYAGVWAHHAHKARNILERGDIEEAMNAAKAIGDDRLQKQGQGYVVPDSFTHGTSEQRARWFRKGLETGDVGQGDTFSIPYERL